VRIIAGQWRGRRLSALGKGDDTARLRPTPDRVRESLFSMLGARGVLDGARVLDLFAGTGAMGLEALSRGAETAHFVENGRVGGRLVSQNIKLLNADARLDQRDATRLGPRNGARFDLIFLDPPYGKGLGTQALQSARDGGWIAPGALVVWEEGAEMQAPDGFVMDDQRRFGDIWVTLLLAD
jgi:16S rRNA (guanine966-N2)-methyltransferase